MAAELVPGVDLLRSTPVLLSLGVLAALTAAAVVLIFQKTSNQMRLRETNNRIQAHLLELRLYRDEPAITWRAQKALLRENLRRLRLLLAPMLITAPPIALLIVCLDAFYGRSPLPPGHAAVVTVKMRSAFNPDSPLPALAAAGAGRGAPGRGQSQAGSPAVPGPVGRSGGTPASS